ncbi:hypothetical protein SAMN05216601_10963 [Ectopseudomonas composti]|uniref:Membrane protein involved in the export of O-antigen and teichoic acid n=1 Tax=Ectopseudomonas composti TaxID=658457 RepID=A0A1I5PG36_9GAMM|nr:hypothetical protein [Pseudomonas composti]SFP33054.1 hypothetical protein SAMN05216601_10963 [Pseudomonas composti]
MRDWFYLVFAAAGVGVAALKGFLYAHVLGEVEYAAVGYYLLVLGFGGLVIGSGVMLRAHTELPVMDRAQRVAFIAQGRGVGFIFWLGLGVPSLLIGSFFWEFSLFSLTLLQVFIMFLFTLDVVARKSDGDFIGYARSVFARNFLLLVGGVSVACATGSARLSILSEVLCGLLACGNIVVNWILNFKLPTKPYLKKSLRFVPVSLLGGVGQYIDRLCASVLLTLTAFSVYSYLSLLMVGALAVQQIVNTKVITLLSVRCAESPRLAYLYLLRVSAFVFFVSFVLMLCAAYALFFSWFAASWVNVGPVIVFLFVVGSAFKAAEFFSSFLVVMHRKKLLALIQLASVLGYALLAVMSYSAGFEAFVSFMVIGMAIYTFTLMLVSWRISLV